MDNILNKYFADELTLKEKEAFLLEVHKDEKLREEFIESQLLMARVDWLSSEGDMTFAQRKLSEFMRGMESAKNI